MSDDAAVRPFRINVPDHVLDDLHRRLEQTRWPEKELVDDWSQGAPLSWIQDMCHYWHTGYDWREQETRLNRFDQAVTEIDGLDIHLIHQRSPHAEARFVLCWRRIGRRIGCLIPFGWRSAADYGYTPTAGSSWPSPSCTRIFSIRSFGLSIAHSASGTRRMFSC